MFGLLPPSSSVTRLMPSAAIFMICAPVAVEPVNATLSMPGCLTRCAPIVGPAPGTMLIDAGGEADLAPRARRAAARDSGVAASGFSTTVQPAASAGASFHVVIVSG